MRGRDRTEVTAERGGLRGRLGSFFRHPAVQRMSALSVGLASLGVLGQCLSTPASALPAAPASIALAVGDASFTAAVIAHDAGAAPAADAGGVGLVGPPVPSADAGGAVDLNMATVDDLRRLPGIGPRRAQAIVDLRAKIGGFKRVEDLMRVRGLGRAATRRLRPLVVVGALPPRP